MVYKKQRVAVVGNGDKIDKVRVITLELRESHIKDLTEIAESSKHEKASMYANGWKSFMREVDKKGKK